MAFKTLYDESMLRYPEQETPQTMIPGYSSPQIRSFGAQRFSRASRPTSPLMYPDGYPAPQSAVKGPFLAQGFLPNRNATNNGFSGMSGTSSAVNINYPRSPDGTMTPIDKTSKYRPTAESSTPASPTQSATNVTPFLWNMMSSMRDMDTESRSEYLATVAAGIKDKLDSFAMRLARGVPLTPEQNKRYMSLRDAFNDIQRYSTNQSAYDEYIAAFNRSGGPSAPAEKEAWRVGQYRS